MRTGALVLVTAMLLLASVANADPMDIGTESDPALFAYPLEHLESYHEDATPFKGWVYIWVQNAGDVAWTDFHFELVDAYGCDATHVSIYDYDNGYDPAMGQTGTISVNNPSGELASIDYYFSGDPIRPGEKAWFEFYADNTSYSEEYFGIDAWPMPEPATLALLAAGVLVSILGRRKA